VKSDDIDIEWKPPKLKSVTPPKGQVKGGEEVKIEFDREVPYEIEFVKFGEAFAEEFEVETSTLLRVKTPQSSGGKTGKVDVEIEVSGHRIQSAEAFEYE
jgi:hypothetical protein